MQKVEQQHCTLSTRRENRRRSKDGVGQKRWHWLDTSRKPGGSQRQTDGEGAIESDNTSRRTMLRSPPNYASRACRPTRWRLPLPERRASNRHTQAKTRCIQCSGKHLIPPTPVSWVILNKNVVAH